MVAGRPRLHDREQIAIDIVEWARKSDSINLNKFCCSYDPPFAPKKITQWSNEDIKFREAVETAKGFLGARREEWLNGERLHVKGYDLNANTYDYFLAEERRDQARFAAETTESAKAKHNTGDNKITVEFKNGLSDCAIQLPVPPVSG